ncbi:MAG: MFS transporter [Sphaerobacteraceae bacterium]|nr:MAG: MFS transporter [Sphaerobacteraceae bacterium]
MKPGGGHTGGAAGWLARLLPDVLFADGYRRLWYTGLLYYQAHWMEITITGWVVLSFTGSAAAVGLVAFFRTLPMLILGLIFGTLADRFPRLAVLGVIQVAGMLASLGFCLLFLAGLEILWVVCVLSTIIGCAWAADFAARRALITELNRPENTGSAMSLEALSLQGGKIVSPVVAGVLLGVGGAPAAYAFLTAMFGLGIVALMYLQRSGTLRRTVVASTIPMLQLIRSGWVAAMEVPVIRVVLIITVIMNLLVFPYQHLIALVAGDILEVGPGRMGMLSGAAGVGSALVAGYLTFRSRPSTALRYFAGGATLSSIGLVGLAMSTSFPLSLVLQLTIGACAGAFGAMQPVLIASSVDPEMRARAMGVLAMAIGTGPIGILLTGTMSSWIGPAWTIGGLAGLATAALVITLVLYRGVLSRARESR